MAISAFAWFTIKRFWKDSNTLIETQREYYSFKRNGALFLSAIKSKRQIGLDSINTKYRISFGDDDAAIKITAVTNPLCGYCKEPFEVFDNLLSDESNSVQVTYVFSTADDPENPGTEISTKIIALYAQNKQLAYEAMKDWYSNKDLEAWTEKYKGINTIMLAPKEALDAHRDWCETFNIMYTPETLINTYNYPSKEYKITDLPLFLDEVKTLAEQGEEILE